MTATMPNARQSTHSATIYRVRMHTGVWKCETNGWESTNLTTMGYIFLPTGTPGNARTILARLRKLKIDTSGIVGADFSIRSTPYCGGHIDLEHAGGKPYLYLERIGCPSIRVSRPVRYSGEVFGQPFQVRTIHITLDGHGEVQRDVAGGFTIAECIELGLAEVIPGMLGA